MSSVCRRRKLKSEVLWQDQYLIVINKAAGVVTLKTDSHKGYTLQQQLEDDFGIFLAERAGLVHRLDKDTSGIILAAKDEFCFNHLQKQFRKRFISKKYLALARGVLKVPGVVKVPIGRVYGLMFGPKVSGKKSETFFQPIRYLKKGKKNFTLLEVFPTTGRTHQIRVHFKFLGHPLVGDKLYGGNQDRSGPLYLSALQIRFIHPISNEAVSFEINRPNYFDQFLNGKKTKGKITS